MLYFETAWNIDRHRELDKTPWELRFGEKFPGQIIPFGASVEFIPHRASRHWQNKKPFGPRKIKGIFMGWALQSGCKWSGGYFIAAISDFDGVYLKEDVGGPHVRPLRCSSVTPDLIDGNFHFPLRARYER